MIGTPGGTADRPALFFDNPQQFRRWLQAHHDSTAELWMGLNKKHVEPQGLTWAEAVEEALCFGWIDSMSQRIDDDARRQRWTPRKPGSIWSSVNVDLVGTLVEQGRMTPAGLAAFERRRADRQGVYSHEQPDNKGVFPPEFEARLRENPAAAAWFDAAPIGYRRVLVHWVLSAKREATRQSRMADLIDDSANGRLVKFQRHGDEPAWVARNRATLGLG